MHGPIDTFLTTTAVVRHSNFTVGSATVHPSTRTITGPGGSMTVEPRVMQVLIALAEAEGAVVTRDELFARCWGSAFVGDDSLNRAIAGVRRVAGSVAANSFEVETVTRTGYRIVGDIRIAAAEDSGADPAPRGVDRRWLIGGALATVAVGGAALWIGRGEGPDPAAPAIERANVALRSGTSEGQREAIAGLEQAVQEMPDSASAWGMLALTRARVDEHAIGRAVPPAAAGKVDEAARRALQLDPGNADAKAALAAAVPYYGDWLAAERRFDAVLAEHPDHVFTQDSRSFFLGAVGRMEESGRDRMAIQAKDVFDADMQNRLIYAHWFLGQTAEADQAAQRGREMWPQSASIWFARLWVLCGTGRLDRAIAQIDDGGRRPKLPQPMVETLRASVLAAQGGDPAAVDRAARRVLAGVQKSVTAVVNGMMMLNLMKASDAAFTLARAYFLEQGPIIAAMAMRPGQPWIPDQRRRKTNMLFTPVGASMRADPRFMPLMEGIGLADYWRKRGILPDFLKDRRT